MLVGGCSSGSASSDIVKNITSEQLANAIKDDTKTKYNPLFPVTELKELAESINLDLNNLENYCLYESVNINSDTLYIAKSKDSEYVGDIKLAFETQLEIIQRRFEFYLPEPYKISLKGEVVTKGKYVMLTICEDVDRAIEIFNNELTEKI